MLLILENTEVITELDGIPCRVWTGQTESGIPVQAHIALIAVKSEEKQDEFVRELQEQLAPRPASARVPVVALSLRGPK